MKLTPRIAPMQTVIVKRWQGFIIAWAGFFVSTALIVVPAYFVYPLWKALLVGSASGSIADILWSVSMIFSKNITIHFSY